MRSSKSFRQRCSAAFVAAITLLIGNIALAQLPAWEARHPQLPGTIVLVGSIHLLREQDYPLPPIIEETYRRADALVLELDLDDLSATDMQMRLMGAAMLSGGQSLADVIDAPLYAAAERTAARYGVELRLFSRFEPWFVATMLLSMGLAELGYEPQYGIEQHLLATALRDGKEVIGLEELDAQVAVFDLLSNEDQAAFLQQTIDELASDSQTMVELVSAWRQGRLEELQEDLLADFEEFPDLYERLVVARNAAWAVSLEKMARADDVYAVVVGALHLVGDDSVVQMLRDNGFTVTQLN